MMQNSAEHAQLWLHSFIILTEGPALTFHEAEQGEKLILVFFFSCGQSTAELKIFLLIHTYIPFTNIIQRLAIFSFK